MNTCRLTLTGALIIGALVASAGAQIVQIREIPAEDYEHFLGSANMDLDPQEEQVFLNDELSDLLILDGLTGVVEFQAQYHQIAGFNHSGSNNGFSPFCDINNDGIMEIVFHDDDKIIYVGLSTSGTSAEGDVTPSLSAASLDRNSPNPFNPSTRISYEITSAADVTLKIYNARGELVRSLIDANVPPGEYEETWDGRDDGGRALASGVYHYELQADRYRSSRKALLLR